MNNAVYRSQRRDNRAVLSQMVRKNEEEAEFPMRNYLCGHYDKCLDHAAYENTMFTCDNCKKFVPAEKRELSSVELRGIMMLWESVFDAPISIH